MLNFTLTRQQTALFVIDMQENMFRVVDHAPETMQAVMQVIKGFEILRLPIFVSEQYPKGLGSTIEPVRHVLGDAYQPLFKTTFSCMDDLSIKNQVMALPFQQWILVGIEAHVCVLQTAKGLLKAGKQVTVLNDAVTSRSIYNYSTAIAEMRDNGVRISSTETVLFELLGDSQATEFKQISQLVKTSCQCACC